MDRDLTNGGMTKAELIEALEDFDDDDIVVIAYPYGDYIRSIAAVHITEVESRIVEQWDGYAGMRVKKEDSDREPEENAETFIVLS